MFPAENSAAVLSTAKLRRISDAIMKPGFPVVAATLSSSSFVISERCDPMFGQVVGNIVESVEPVFLAIFVAVYLPGTSHE